MGSSFTLENARRGNRNRIIVCFAVLLASLSTAYAAQSYFAKGFSNPKNLSEAQLDALPRSPGRNGQHVQIEGTDTGPTGVPFVLHRVGDYADYRILKLQQRMLLVKSRGAIPNVLRFTGDLEELTPEVKRSVVDQLDKMWPGTGALFYPFAIVLQPDPGAWPWLAAGALFLVFAFTLHVFIAAIRATGHIRADGELDREIQASSTNFGRNLILTKAHAIHRHAFGFDVLKFNEVASIQLQTTRHWFFVPVMKTHRLVIGSGSRRVLSISMSKKNAEAAIDHLQKLASLART